MTAIVGVDIAKDQVDVCLLIDDTPVQYGTVPNNKRGLNKLDRWLNNQGQKGRIFASRRLASMAICWPIRFIGVGTGSVSLILPG